MNLSINEQLMNDTKDANLCIFIANLGTWLRTNAKKDDPKNRNFHEGRCWSYNSIQEFVRYFGFWSTKNIRTIIANCIKLDLITTNTFNKKKYDNTLWYTLTDKGLEYFPCLRDFLSNRLVDSGKGLADSGNAIPELPYQSSNNITTNSSSNYKSKTKPNLALMQLIDVYREVFPNNPQPHERVIATSLQKTLSTLVKRWPELDPNGNPLTLETFKTYLEMMRDRAPKFALGEYETPNGTRKKNSLETFARWNTVVKFLENQYS